ncbi:phospholipase/carboxylesterase family protein-like protein [Clohesyomyces aquaticus]|uniref:Phospholipase/carboxylesterase family protein-like protein n=1 Tax=Clohesyomyces aquaticus TaxID=1231657 RepID=A0A1Y1YXD5_9PLEO|nr:phospholipase/carboxylesterase family protein-like protein [Clohesyomyces aquaticus]
MPPSASKSPVHSPPLIVPSLHTHKTTLIVLHGRGFTAQKFAEPILTHPVSSLLPSTTSLLGTLTHPGKVFRDYFPHTKFVFPTAPLRRAVVFQRSLTHQWFDNWSLTQPELKQHLQAPGLRETAIYLHDLLQKEIDVVGPKNVVLIGLSQGCASSLITTLLWEGEPFGAVVGMCGYLPFRKGMLDFATGGEEQEEDPLAESEDMFEREDGDPKAKESDSEKAIRWLREELQAEREKTEKTAPFSFESIPVFMGHGTEDEKVPREIGRLAADFLDTIGVNIEWKEYEGLGHWYSADMLRDVVRFFKGLDGWEDTTDESRTA